MSAINDLFSKYRKIVYIVSMLSFMLIGLDSPIKKFVYAAVLIAVISSPLKLRSVKSMNPQEYFIAAVIIGVMLLVDNQELSINLITSFILSLYFVIHTVDIIYLEFSELLKNKPPHKNHISSPITKAETIVIAISSVLVMTFFTTSSPLFRFNYWDDVNCYFTLGRSIINGLVPYRDVYEQKGPYLYFVHSLAALISEESFVGIFIIEIIACFVFAYFVWKTIHIFYTPTKYSLALIPIFIILTYSVVPFHFGDSAEEICFPVLAIIVYIAFKAEANNKLPSIKETAIIGAITGYLFFIKYTFCGLILGYLIFVIIKSFMDKKLKELPKLILSFLIGFIIISLPVLIYFAANNALEDLYTAYFYNNIFLYAPGNKPNTLSNFLFVFNFTMIRSVYTFYGIVLSLFTLSGLKKNFKIMYILMLIFSCVGIYLPPNHMFYYCFILTAATVPGFIVLSVFWDKFCTRMKSFKFRPDILALLCLIAIFTNVFISQPNLKLINQPLDEIPQFVFAEKINSTPDAKILTYDVMDAGFYNCSGTLPCSKYYCYLNISDTLPELQESQLQLISDGEFDYIITRNNNYDWDNYAVIDSFTVDSYNQLRIPNNGKYEITYFLYARA